MVLFLVSESQFLKCWEIDDIFDYKYCPINIVLMTEGKQIYLKPSNFISLANWASKYSKSGAEMWLCPIVQTSDFQFLHWLPHRWDVILELSTEAS